MPRINTLRPAFGLGLRIQPRHSVMSIPGISAAVRKWREILRLLMLAQPGTKIRPAPVARDSVINPVSPIPPTVDQKSSVGSVNSAWEHPPMQSRISLTCAQTLRRIWFCRECRRQHSRPTKLSLSPGRSAAHARSDRRPGDKDSFVGGCVAATFTAEPSSRRRFGGAR